jgi:class 3 adenylate cyclase
MTAPDPRSILFADIVGSTALYRRLGDTRAEELVNLALQRVAAIAQQHGGHLVKTIGDCALCEFQGPDAAAHTAMEVQRRSVATQTTDAEPIHFRIGFMHGPVVSRDQDVFGDAVNVASRLCDIAKLGQILTVESTARLMEPELRSGVRLFDQTPIKGVNETLTIVQLLWDRRAATQIFIAPQLMPGAGAEALALSYGGETRLLTEAQLPFTIGREPGCSLVVPSPCASRFHARIERHRGKFTLIDESTNGTYVLPDGSAPERAVYIRREVFALLGRGAFSLGERPDSGSEHLLCYEVS